MNDLVTASYTYFIHVCVGEVCGKVFRRTDLRYLVLVHMLLFPWLINLTRIINDLPEFVWGNGKVPFALFMGSINLT